MSQLAANHQPYDHEVWETGSEPQTTTEGLIAAGQTLDKRMPLGVKTSTGEFHKWNPDASDGTENAVRIAAYNLDTTGSVKSAQLIKTGVFNPELIVWPDGTTDAQKLAAFVGTPISLQTPR
jgi:hypothetical protein